MVLSGKKIFVYIALILTGLFFCISVLLSIIIFFEIKRVYVNGSACVLSQRNEND